MGYSVYTGVHRVFIFSRYICPEVELLDYMITLFLVFLVKPPYHLPQWLHHLHSHQQHLRVSFSPHPPTGCFLNVINASITSSAAVALEHRLNRWDLPRSHHQPALPVGRVQGRFHFTTLYSSKPSLVALRSCPPGTRVVELGGSGFSAGD